MGGWSIACLDKREECGAWAANVRELIEEHRDEDGWFKCRCGGQGYILKTYPLQEGDKWSPILVGGIRFDENPRDDETYFPLVFLVAYSEDNLPKPKEYDDIWFYYYKDTRPEGHLKTGGPPVVSKEQLRNLVAKLRLARPFGPMAIRSPPASA